MSVCINYDYEKTMKYNQPFPSVHQFEGVIDFLKRKVACDEFIHQDLTRKVILNELRNGVATLPATKGAAGPYSSGY